MGWRTVTISPCRTGTGPFSDRLTYAPITLERQMMLTLCQSVHENRIYSVSIHCDDSYPDKPPVLKFLSKVNLPCVDPRTGRVDPAKLPCLANWRRDYSMETVLIELRR